MYKYVAFVKKKEQIFNNFQKNCFSAVTRTICWLTSIVMIVRVEVGRNMGWDLFNQYFSNKS